MILRFFKDATEERVQAVRERCERRGRTVIRSDERARAILAIIGKHDAAFERELAADPSVEAIVDTGSNERVLVHRAFRDERSVVEIGDVKVGGHEVVVIAGPCSVEGRETVLENAKQCARAGAHILRGGAFKPRTSPYAFQGFGVEGLRQLKDAGDAVGMPVVSEIMDAADIPAFVACGIDCFQIGARNMQNFSLLKAVAAVQRPVLLKRGLAATVDEWLSAAEYLLHGGARDVILCERGIRTFERATRNTLDLTVLPLLQEWTHLPILVDPAHAAGIARLVRPLSRASMAAGADGVAVEVHSRPSEARSDGPQALLPSELAELVADVRVLAAVTDRRLHATTARRKELHSNGASNR